MQGLDKKIATLGLSRVFGVLFETLNPESRKQCPNFSRSLLALSIAIERTGLFFILGTWLEEA